MTYATRSFVLTLLTASLLASPAFADNPPASAVKVDPHLAHIFRPNTNSPFWEATDLLPPNSGLPKPDFEQLMRRAWQRSARLAQTGPTAADWAAAVQDERQLPPSGEQRGCVRTQTLTDKGMLSIRECLERPVSFAEAVGWFAAQGHGLAGTGIDRPGRLFTMDDSWNEQIVFYYSTKTLALSEVIFHSTALGAFAAGKPNTSRFLGNELNQQVRKLRQNEHYLTPPSDLSQLLERSWQRLKRINQSGPTAADWALAVKDEAAEAAASGNNSCVRTQTVTTQGVLNIRECLNRPVQAIEAMDWLRQPEMRRRDGSVRFNSPGRMTLQLGDELASLYYTPGDLVLREVVFFQQALK